MAMDDFKEFQWPDLDGCIAQAQRWFNCDREMLEIEIVQDAKSGLFGIGGRKAIIHARRAPAISAMRDFLGQSDEKSAAGELKEETETPGSQELVQSPAFDQEIGEDDLQEEEDPLEDGRPPLARLEDLDCVKLENATREIVANLVRPLAGREVAMSVDLSSGRPAIKIDWQGDAGLLIGREGQTLVAIQYLASRMLSKAMHATLRVQLDIGDYRARQDDKLRALALSLAEKARRSGRAFSTRPLSSYHRRVIHMCLQKAPDVQTSSSGEGPLKRVLISPRRR